MAARQNGHTHDTVIEVVFEVVFEEVCEDVFEVEVVVPRCGRDCRVLLFGNSDISDQARFNLVAAVYWLFNISNRRCFNSSRTFCGALPLSLPSSTSSSLPSLRTLYPLISDDDVGSNEEVGSVSVVVVRKELKSNSPMLIS
jgi:hypothetical protein